MFKKIILTLFSGLILTEVTMAQTKYGVGSYNTEEVAAEMEYIEKHIRPLNPKPTKRIFITGSSAGIGELTAKMLLAKGYEVVAHARDAKRAADVKRDLPEIKHVVIGDLAKPDEVDKIADQVNALGRFDVIIHNAGVYRGENIFQINLLAPYVLTAKITQPQTLIYVSSNMHNGGELRLDAFNAGNVGYSDSKLQLLTLAKSLAVRWPKVRVNAMHPGWVGTKMSGGSAPDPLRQAYETLVWLAEGTDPAAQTSGGYFFNKQPDSHYRRDSEDPAQQAALLQALEKITGVKLPE